MRGLRPRNSERDAVRNLEEGCSRGRRPASETEVTFDDKVLDLRTDLGELSRTGFEWCNDGAGPVYLAPVIFLRIIASHIHFGLPGQVEIFYRIT